MLIIIIIIFSYTSKAPIARPMEEEAVGTSNLKVTVRLLLVSSV